MKQLLLLAVLCIAFASCENVSNGDRVGYVTKFTNDGRVWKSWEGQLNMTQTGMNSAQTWDFSIDNDNEPDGVVATLDSALEYGWKVRLSYHGVWLKNIRMNRGHTDHFVTKVEVLERPRIETGPLMSSITPDTVLHQSLNVGNTLTAQDVWDPGLFRQH